MGLLGGSSDDNQTSDLVTAQVLGVRSELVERLKQFALKGMDAFETELRQIIREIAESQGYGNPENTKLRQLQHDHVIGASSLFVYACALKRMIRSGDIEGIRRANSTSLTRSRLAPRAADAETIISELICAHREGKLGEGQYRALAAILRGKVKGDA